MQFRFARLWAAPDVRPPTALVGPTTASAGASVMPCGPRALSTAPDAALATTLSSSAMPAGRWAGRRRCSARRAPQPGRDSRRARRR